MNVYAKDLLRRVMLLWLGASGEERGGCVLNLVFLRGRGGCTRMALFRLNLKC